MLKLDKGIKPPTRETYTQYLDEVKSKGYRIDHYDENTPLEELERIQKHIRGILYENWLMDIYGVKDLTTKQTR
jgi:hypothetical protein